MTCDSCLVSSTIGSRERSRGDSTEIVNALVYDGRKYRREATQRLRAIVSEGYSAPRVTEVARRFPMLGIIPGTALDLTGVDEEGNAWDFSVAAQRDKADKLIDKEKPILLIGSPSCTPFSNIQNLNKNKRDPKIVEKKLQNGRMHLVWCCYLYLKQVARGACFLYEHPALATS